jgi:hypothetical protein
MLVTAGVTSASKSAMLAAVPVVAASDAPAVAPAAASTVPTTAANPAPAVAPAAASDAPADAPAAASAAPAAAPVAASTVVAPAAHASALVGSNGSHICARCLQPLGTLGGDVVALGRSWHAACFSCVVCHRLFSAKESFFSHDSQPICDTCQLASETAKADKCAACGEPILTAQVTALSRPWHASCFTCSACKATLSAAVPFYESGGMPQCGACHLAARNATAPRCCNCGEPVLEDTVTSSGRTFHPDCFVCAACLRSFGQGEAIYKRDGWPVCHDHALGTLPPGAAERMRAGMPLRRDT